MQRPQPILEPFHARASRAAPVVGMSGGGALNPHTWVSLDEAASFLSVPAITLRRALERNTRKAESGAVVAEVDGITARKLGRHWRLQLDAGWLGPSCPSKRASLSKESKK